MNRIKHLLGTGLLALMLTTPAMADTRLVFAAANTSGVDQPQSGSWFSLKVLDLDFDGVNEASIYTPVSSATGIVIGTAQRTDIDGSWNYFGKPGHHVSQSAVSATDAGGNTQTLDFSGWAMSWQNTVLALGTDNLPDSPDGIATMSCDNSCAAGETFTLDYSANIPADSPHFAGADYHLHLTGTIEQAQ